MKRQTLLVFTRGVESEAACRRLLPARLAPMERALHRECLSATLRAGRDAGCRVVVSSPTAMRLPAAAAYERQRGRNFGERIGAAMRRVHADADGAVMVVGTDAPGLTANHLERAGNHLERHPNAVVVGPSRDGGFYLLASRRSLERELDGVSWCTGDTLRSLLDRLDLAGIPVHLLDPLDDLDRPQDLQRWLTRASGLSSHSGLSNGWGWLLPALLRALAELRRPALLGADRPRPSWPLRLPGNRAAPVCA